MVLDIGNSLKIYEEKEKQRKPFTLNQIPVLFTFAVFNKDILDPESEGDCYILDPTVGLLETRGVGCQRQTVHWNESLRRYLLLA